MANKSKLNELVHKGNFHIPEYSTFPKDSGFICKVKVGKEVFVSKVVHSRKKAAEDDAAAVAVNHFTTSSSKIVDTSALSSTDKEQSSSIQPFSLTAKSVKADCERKVENLKEIPINMFYPSGRQTDKPSDELQDYCCSKGWTEPIYHLKMQSQKSTCGIYVNKTLYSFEETYSSDEDAKQEAARKVLAKLTGKSLDVSEVTTTETKEFPASKQSHPATAKLAQLTENGPDASVDEITTAISNLATLSESDASGTKQSVGDKNTLQYICQKRGLSSPEYKTEYPPGVVGYMAEVTVDGKAFRSKVHGSKKAAEASAAREAIEYLTANDSELGKTVTSLATTRAPDIGISYKNLLQEYLQKQKLPLPTFRTMASSEREGFVSTVAIRSADGKDMVFESSVHSSKKAAEQNAAAIACQSFNLTA